VAQQVRHYILQLNLYLGHYFISHLLIEALHVGSDHGHNILAHLLLNKGWQILLNVLIDVLIQLGLLVRLVHQLILHLLEFLRKLLVLLGKLSKVFK
jgi:hypothetical protein